MNLLTHRRAWLATLALTLLIIVAPPTAQADLHEPRPIDPITPDLTIATAPDGLRYHFPGAVRLDDGSILVTARQGSRHSSPDGAIVIARSDGKTLTWPQPHVAWDSIGDDRDPKLSQSSTGRVFLHFFTSDPGQVGATTGDFVMYSDDRGLSWSEPRRVETRMAWAASHGEIIETADGSLLAPIYGSLGSDSPGTLRSSVVRSVDGGQTWSATNEVMLPHVPARQVVEPVLTVLPDGSITALLRVNSGPAEPWQRFSLLTRSYDNGATWTAIEQTNLVTSSAETEVLGDGSVFVAYGDLAYRFAERRLTSATVIKRPDRTWRAPTTAPIWDAVVDDQANPAVVEISPRRVLVIGFDYLHRSLVATAVDADDLTSAPSDDEQLRDTLDLAAMVSQERASIDTDLTVTGTQPRSVSAPELAIDGRLGATSQAQGEGTSGQYTITFDTPQRLTEIGVALRPGEAQSARVTVQTIDGTWQPVGELPEQWRYGDIDWIPMTPAVAPIIKLQVSIAAMTGPHPWPGNPRPVAISEIAVRGTQS